MVLSEPPIFSLDQSAGDALVAELGAVVGPLAASDRPRAAVESGGTPTRTVGDLSTVAVPALVIAGTTSHPALRSISRVLARELPHARLVELPKSGHVTHAERPDEFASTVAAFTTELQPARRAGTGNARGSGRARPRSRVPGA